MLYHVILVALLVAITFIDADLTIVPASITNLGIILGLAIGAVFPGDPAGALGGRHVPRRVVGRGEGDGRRRGLDLGDPALGNDRLPPRGDGRGDIHIMAMVGAFLGWQVAVVTPFLAAFVGLVPGALEIMAIYLVEADHRTEI